jgi:hypothetical protein
MPRAAYFRDRAATLATYAYARDSRRAALLVVPLLQLAEATASIEAQS